MDCQKARYFLVVSFDETPSDADRAELAFHLRDCRACRHESFYYRELFSAEKQIAVHHPRGDFNERLLAEVRLREARSAWPVAETPRRFRWPLVYVPALFGAAALAGFLFFLPEQPSSTALTVVEPAPSVSQPIQAALERPRYVPSPRIRTQSKSTMMFEWPSPNQTEASGDPFRPMLVSGGSNLRYMRPRSQEQYVLPVVTQMVERDRIY